ncbi:MAG: hypothetical protein R3A48_01530 [Polyangiales bacterium]
MNPHRALRHATLSLLLAASGCDGTTPVATPDAAARDVSAVTDIAPADAAAPVDAPAAVPLGLNDVSVLFPLPSGADAEGYLHPLDEGPRGVLLPPAVFDAIPTFPVIPAQGLVYDRMRVIAVRFDGCGRSPDACRPEVRMVMQPVNADGTLRDSALHLFYELTPEAMTEVVAELRRLRADHRATTGAPLDVHPTLVAEGVTGAYGTALRALLLRQAGEQNLIRVTFFLRAPPVQEVWFFGGLERVDGDFVAMNIVGVGRGNQRVIRAPVDGGYDFNLTPVGDAPEDGRALLTSAAATSASDAQRRAAMGSYLRVENPRRYVPDQLPCAGCHLAAFITAETTRRFGLDPGAFSADRFTSERDLTRRGGAADEPSSLRAFGWFGRTPMIAQRTVNESAAVLEHLEANYPSR